VTDPEPSASVDLSPARRKRPRSVVDWMKLGFLIAVVGFGIVFVADRWADLAAALHRLSPALVAVAFLVGVLGAGLPMLAWRTIVADLGSPLAWPDAGRVFYISQLGKYLPGSVWTLLAQVELGRELKVPRKVSACAGILALVVSLAVGLGLAALLLPFAVPEAVHRFWWILFVIPVLFAVLHPRIFGGILDLVLRLVRHEPLAVRPSYRGNLHAAGWMAVSWTVLGVHVWLLVVGLGGAPIRSLPITVGGFALAFCLGVLFIPAPAGAGIRDIALGIVLGTVITSSGAVTVALVSRVMVALADFLLAGAFTGLTRARRAQISTLSNGRSE